jgi:hypothetical protein
MLYALCGARAQERDDSMTAPGDPLVSPALVTSVFPRATRTEPLPDVPGGCTVLQDDTVLGYLVDSRALAINVNGYAGPTPVVVAVDVDGVVQRIDIHPNKESPGYLRRVCDSPWWRSLTGYACTQVVARLSGVDSVSGATYTSSALREHVRTALQQLRACMRREHAHELPASCAWLIQASRWLPTVVLYAVVIVLARRPQLHTRAVRWAVWISVVALLGFWRPNYFSFSQPVALVTGGLPPAYAVAWYLTVAFALVSPLFFGRAYCRHLCPFGVLSEMLAALSPVQLTLPRWAVRLSRFTRFGMLVLGVVLAVALPHLPLERLEPFNAIFVRSSGWLYVLLGVVALLASAVFRRLWCVMFCLDGALFELITRLRWKRSRVSCRRRAATQRGEKP